MPQSEWWCTATPTSARSRYTRFTYAAALEKTLAEIDTHPGEDCRSPASPRVPACPRSAFAAAFTQDVGEPPMSYVTRARMRRAAEILRSTDLSTGAVAAAVGYRSGASLARSFRRRYRISPAAYRRTPSPRPEELLR
jgi:transcriptional regulator GlxA family with amidase domain